MKQTLLAAIGIGFIFASLSAQPGDSIKDNNKAVYLAADQFLQTLTPEQKAKAQFSFDTEERLNWYYVPRDDRKGISLNELNETQRKAAFILLHSSVADNSYNKAVAITQLEPVLKVIENRKDDDHFRDPGKYFISIFGHPSADSIWGWRFEGHHVAFNFSSANNKLVSGTPSFLGSNPAIVLAGPDKGKQVLKDETELGYSFLKSLDSAQFKKALISVEAPGEIFTTNSRKALISNPQGILYNELTAAQQKIFLQLLSLYIHRYTRFLAMNMMQEIEKAGLNNLRFAWAGVVTAPGPGNPQYYRIQGPSIIIEYDNTQNNANHVHTVIRDLNNDFGGDELMEHYKNDKHSKN